MASPLCPRCGVPFPAFADAPAKDHVCGRCLERPPSYDAARCALLFEGPVRALVHLFKFDHRPDLAKPLARAMVAALPREERFDLVLPVPLHWTRLLKRGYNQASLLARRISRARGAPVAARLLVKTRRTRDQAGLDATARSKNLEKAFAVRRSPFAAPAVGRRRALQDRSVLLVDDVLTTGATVEACARVLKREGAARVFVIAVARTPLGRVSGRGPFGSLDEDGRA